MPTKDDFRFYFFPLNIFFVNVKPSKRKYFIASRIQFACTRNALARCGSHLYHHSAESSRAGVSQCLRLVFYSFRSRRHRIRKVLFTILVERRKYTRHRFAPSLNGVESVIVHSRALCVENDKQEKLALCESFGMIMWILVFCFWHKLGATVRCWIRCINDRRPLLVMTKEMDEFSIVHRTNISRANEHFMGIKFHI